MPVLNPQGQPQRTVEEVKGTPRSGVRSIWRSSKEAVAVENAAARTEATGVPQPTALEPARTPGPRPPMRDRLAFLTRSIGRWLTNFVGHMFERTRALPPYPQGQTGIYTMPDDVRIALASDWGTGTESAYAVGAEIAGKSPDITIHLGDVYYSGTSTEYKRYFLADGAWPRGKRPTPGSAGEASGTYVLNANHEMYSGGEGYFDDALPALKQTTSYFCLENEHWRIVAIDTGYHCSRGFKKILSFIFGDTTRLDDANLAWARQVFGAPSRKPVILLSHHQPFSAFDKRVYPNLADQLRPFLDQVGLWFWGHEHKLAGYEAFSMKGGPPIRGRCIGHGGMPIELGWEPTKNPAPVVFSDERDAGRVVESSRLGYCGYALLELAGPKLTITYSDELGNDLVREEWEIAAGTMHGKAALLKDDPGIHRYRELNRLAR